MKLQLLSVVLCFLVANQSTVFAQETTSDQVDQADPSKTVASTAGFTPQQVYLKYREVLSKAQSIEQLRPFLVSESIERIKQSASKAGLDAISEMKRKSPSR